MTSHPRRSLIGIALACVLALAIALMVDARSMPHRANSALSDLQDLPGVSSASAQNYPESGDDPRHGVVTMRSSATVADVARVLEHADAVAGGDAVDDVSVRVGTARARVTGSTEHAVDAASTLAAVARWRHGSAEVVPHEWSGGAMITLDPDGQSPVSAAEEVVQLLAKRNVPDGYLVVGAREYTSPVRIDAPWSKAARVLSAVHADAKHLRTVSVVKVGVTVTADLGVSTIDLHRRLASVVRQTFPATSLTVAGTGDEVEIHGTGQTTTVTKTADELASHDVKLTRLDLDGSRIDVTTTKGRADAGALPEVARAVDTLRPAPAADCDVTVVPAPGRDDAIFTGKPADLARLAPKFGAAAAKGYDVSWQSGRRVSIVLPAKSTLDVKSASTAMAIARSLGWKGKAWVDIATRPPDGSSIADSVRFTSTATGTTQDLSGDVDDAAAMQNAWNATATSGKAATS